MATRNEQPTSPHGVPPRPSVEPVSVPDGWERAERYDEYMGRWSARVALAFLDWLALPGGRRWLDVGSGTGALARAIADRCAPAALCAIEPAAGLLAGARTGLAGRAWLVRGEAMHVPLRPGSFDAVVSGLVLNFVPDPRAALREMRRVVPPGGMIAAYVWDYAERMQILRRFWDAATALDPAASSLDEGTRFPLCGRDALGDLFREAGLEAIEVVPVEIPAVFSSYEDYWRPFLGGTGPAPSYVASLDGPARQHLRDALRRSLPSRADRPFTLTTRAWAARGTNSV